MDAPTTVVASDVGRRNRRARIAVGAVFLTNGALFANLVPRYPQIKSELGLNNAALGSAIAAFPLGALVAGLFAAPLIARFGSARLASGGIVLLATAMTMVSVAPGWLALAAVLAISGAIDSIVDVAQNTHALRVQRAYRRSIVNSFHGIWSIGAVTGGLMGSAAAGLDMALSTHLIVSGAVFSMVALTAFRFLLPGTDDSERVVDPIAAEGSPGIIHRSPGPSPGPIPGRSPGRSAERSAGRAARRSVVRTLAVLGVIAACGALVEDSGASWGAVYLRNNIGTSAATAGMAFVAFQIAMTTGRLLGDRITDRYGQRVVVRTGGLLAGIGMGAALAAPTTGTTLVGYALAGLGVSTLIPAAMHAADELPGLANGLGLSAVSWLLRVGFLLSPPIVGLIADATSLRVGLLSVVLAGCVIIVLSRVFPPRPTNGAANVVGDVVAKST
ncbi:MAG: MFS transporter [Ilumatobacteraceae bacterium]